VRLGAVQCGALDNSQVCCSWKWQNWMEEGEEKGEQLQQLKAEWNLYQTIGGVLARWKELVLAVAVVICMVYFFGMNYLS